MLFPAASPRRCHAHGAMIQLIRPRSPGIIICPDSGVLKAICGRHWYRTVGRRAHRDRHYWRRHRHRAALCCLFPRYRSTGIVHRVRRRYHRLRGVFGDRSWTGLESLDTELQVGRSELERTLTRVEVAAEGTLVSPLAGSISVRIDARTDTVSNQRYSPISNPKDGPHKGKSSGQSSLHLQFRAQLRQSKSRMASKGLFQFQSSPTIWPTLTNSLAGSKRALSQSTGRRLGWNCTTRLVG